MARVLLIAICFAAALSTVDTATQGPEGRAPRNAAEFDTMFQQIKNWGRWGADDQLGSANLLTDATRKRAVRLAKTGQSVSLSHPLMTDKADDNTSPFEHTMLTGFSMDNYRVSYHGYAHSHIDGLCHILYKDRDLEDVAVMAAKRNRWEFMLTIAPLVVTGGTGSPANILATF